MKLQGKLIVNSFSTLVPAINIIMFLIGHMKNLQTSNNDLVGAMLNVQELKGAMILSVQALSTYSFVTSEEDSA